MTTKIKVLTPAYNCASKIERTLWSVIGQTYKNWEMIIVDDMSTDNTVEFIQTFAEAHGFSDRIKIKSRSEKHGEVRNTLVECKLLDNEDVVVRLDAGDYITDLGCFEMLDEHYTEHDPAVLWTQQRWKFTTVNVSGPIDPEVSFYEQPWRTSHLKTFRVKDFKGLNPKNFLDEDGDYIMIACDQAIFLPMLERARLRRRPMVFIPRVMYHYDTDSVEDFSVFFEKRSLKQKNVAQWIRSRGYIP